MTSIAQHGSGHGATAPTEMSGRTTLIAHIGYPTSSFRAPMIYNPYFRDIGVDARVVPMGVKREDFAAALPVIFRMTNVTGALITMPHKVAVVGLLDEVSTAVRIAGSCNAVRRCADGRLVGDMFDGEGFVRGLARNGQEAKGASALVVGAGGVGSAIAASLAAAGAARLRLADIDPKAVDGLRSRLSAHYPRLTVEAGDADPAGMDIVVNATPLGMKAGDPLPIDAERLSPTTFVGEVVMSQEITPFLAAARARGCRTQAGIEMLYEMIPAYLEFFGYPTTTPDRLRALAQIAW